MMSPLGANSATVASASKVRMSPEGSCHSWPPLTTQCPSAEMRGARAVSPSSVAPLNQVITQLFGLPGQEAVNTRCPSGANSTSVRAEETSWPRVIVSSSGRALQSGDQLPTWYTDGCEVASSVPSRENAMPLEHDSDGIVATCSNVDMS